MRTLNRLTNVAKGQSGSPGTNENLLLMSADWSEGEAQNLWSPRRVIGEDVYDASLDAPNSATLALAEMARARFFARHGRSADLPRRSLGSKQIRKALLAAEMACWESY